MEKRYLNLKDVTNIETVWHAGWALSDDKESEIVLLVDKESLAINHPGILLATYMAVIEGILNSSNDDTKPKKVIDSKVGISNYDQLANELTKVTGYKFSIELID